MVNPAAFGLVPEDLQRNIIKSLPVVYRKYPFLIHRRKDNDLMICVFDDLKMKLSQQVSGLLRVGLYRALFIKFL